MYIMFLITHVLTVERKKWFQLQECLAGTFIPYSRVNFEYELKTINFPYPFLDTGCCKEDLLVTCDGTNTGLKKEGSTEAEKENVCTAYHSWTAQKGIFGCYKKEKKEEAKGRIWPFTSSTGKSIF